MKLETFKKSSTEVTIEHAGLMIIVNTWGNLEGCTFIVHEKDGLGHRVSGSMTWEELDGLMVALQAGRAF